MASYSLPKSSRSGNGWDPPGVPRPYGTDRSSRHKSDPVSLPHNGTYVHAQEYRHPSNFGQVTHRAYVCSVVTKFSALATRCTDKVAPKCHHPLPHRLDSWPRGEPRTALSQFNNSKLGLMRI